MYRTTINTYIQEVFDSFVLSIFPFIVHCYCRTEQKIHNIDLSPHWFIFNYWWIKSNHIASIMHKRLASLIADKHMSSLQTKLCTTQVSHHVPSQVLLFLPFTTTGVFLTLLAPAIDFTITGGKVHLRPKSRALFIYLLSPDMYKH